MKVEVAYPPIFGRIKEVFPGAAKPGVIFAWGDTIFNPSGQLLSRPIFKHEEVHGKRQRGDPLAWWDRYLFDQEFRYEEELYAHAAEYLAQEPLCDGDRNRRAKLLQSTAIRLIAQLYNYAPPRYLSVALHDLREVIQP
jgi:hypothetical protein